MTLHIDCILHIDSHKNKRILHLWSGNSPAYGVLSHPWLSQLMVTIFIFFSIINNYSVTEGRLSRTKTTPTLNSSTLTAASKGLSFDLTDDSMALVRRELEVEERIVVAARRMAELHTSNRRERQKRKQSLQQLVLLCMCMLALSLTSHEHQSCQGLLLIPSCASMCCF